MAKPSTTSLDPPSAVSTGAADTPPDTPPSNDQKATETILSLDEAIAKLAEKDKLIESLAGAGKAADEYILQLESDLAAAEAAQHATSDVVWSSDGKTRYALQGIEDAPASNPRWIACSNDTSYYHEELVFAEDTGYSLNMITRAQGVIDRFFGLDLTTKMPVRCGEMVGRPGGNGQTFPQWEWNKMPPFNPNNRLKVTIEIVAAPLSHPEE